MIIALLIYFSEVNSIFTSNGYFVENTFKTMKACQIARIEFEKQISPGEVYPIDGLNNRWFYLSPACEKMKKR